MLRFLIVALVSAVLVVISPAPSTTPTTPTPPADGRITGTVFCTDTHKPARGAIVLLDSPPSADAKQSEATGEAAYTRVADDGTYVLDDVPPGDYVISAVLPGYLTPSKRTEEAAKKSVPEDGRITVHPAKTATAQISLQRGAAISGRVLYADGSPAIHVVVFAEDVHASLKHDDQTVGIDVVMRSTLLHPSPLTDDFGRFRISGIAPGTYRVVVVQSSTNRPGMGDSGLSPEIFAAYKVLRTYSGDTMHSKAAKQYELHGEAEVAGLEITLPTDTLHSVRGMITAEDGRPITAATITLTDTADDALVLQGDMEPDGAFTFARVPFGAYKLAATNAEIGKLPSNLPPGSSMRFVYRRMTNSFADGGTSVVVKDSNVANVNVTLREIHLPTARSGEGK